MGRSAEDDRDVLALPLNRPRRHLSSGSTPTRVHPPSFDPDAARKAWRQVARVRGGGPSLGADPRRRPSLMLFLGVVAAVGVVWMLWSYSDEPAQPLPPPVQVAAQTLTAEPSATASATADQRGAASPALNSEAPSTPSAGVGSVFPSGALAMANEPAPLPPSSIGTFKPNTARMAPPATEDASQQRAPQRRATGRPPAVPRGQAQAPAPQEPPSERPPARWDDAIPMPAPRPAPATPAAEAMVPSSPESEASSNRPLIQRGRPTPPGTSSPGAAAFKKIPKSSRDRAPLAGIGVSGIHIDRLDLGSSYSHGACQGPNRDYSVSKAKSVNVCFRAVHRRQSERVLVKWTKNGRLVRRAWIVIPAAHAYRTRAGLRLREASVGKWTVTVESADGVVLGSGDFKVTP